MPGVYVQTATANLTPNIAAGAGRYMAVVTAGKGDITEARLIRSMTEFETFYGTRAQSPVAWDDLSVFFAEGGAEAYIARATGTGMVAATLTITGGALKIDAISPGLWGNQVRIQISAGALPLSYKLSVFEGTVLREVYDALTSNDACVAATANSSLIKVTKLTAVNATVQGPTNLAAGADGTAPTTAQLTAALSLFSYNLGSGIVAIPGQPSTTVGQAVIDHAKLNRRVAVLTTPIATTNLVAATNATALIQAGGEHAMLAWPWVRMTDSNGPRLVSPAGFVAACRSRVVGKYGSPAAAGAGEIGAARTLTGVETELTLQADYDTLNESGVSAIRMIQGTPRMYGWQSLATDRVNYRHLYVRDLVNAVFVEAEAALETFVFRPIDAQGRLFAELKGVLIGIAAPYASQGLLYAKKGVDPGYVVDVGPGVNTPGTIAANELRAVLGLRPSPTAEIVRLTIVRLPAL